mmetsp:Transcript_31688/g.63209  ORF Transcript_31688/g.63209 Transcript_31688/m.63209 type:complete len:263 (-) Transcript_31688:1494-2282(-)
MMMLFTYMFLLFFSFLFFRFVHFIFSRFFFRRRFLFLRVILVVVSIDFIAKGIRQSSPRLLPNRLSIARDQSTGYAAQPIQILQPVLDIPPVRILPILQLFRSPKRIPPVQRPPERIHRRLPPPSDVIPVTRPRRQRGIQPRNPHVRITRRRAVPLHVDQPRGGTEFVGHAQRLPEPLGQISRPEMLARLDDFVFLPLVVEIAEIGEVLGFGLMNEEGFVEGAVVDVDSGGAARDAETVLLFDGHFGFVLGGGVADGGYASF